MTENKNSLVAVNDEAAEVAVEAASQFTPAPLASPELGDLLRDRARTHSGQMRVAHLVAAASMDGTRRVGPFIHVANLGWLTWDGKRFAQDDDDKLVCEAVMLVIRDHAFEALSDKELLASLKTAQSANGLQGVLKLMAALPGIRASVEDLDSDPYLFSFQNGTVDLRDLFPTDGVEEPVDLHGVTLRPHDPADRITRVARANFDPDAISAEWDAFIAQVLPDESVREYLRRTIGLGMIGEQLEHQLDVLTGVGRNGKGVCYNTFHFAFGDYSHVAPSSLFELVKGDPNKPQPAFLTLRGRRFVWLSETDKGARIDAALLKRLTGGDPITGRRLNKNDEITFVPSHSLFLITNHPPRLPADDEAVWERLKVVLFGVVVPKEERDGRLPSKLKKHIDAIATWALVGLADYAVDGLDEPEAVRMATDNYQNDQDTVAQFIEDMCVEEPGDNGSGSKRLHDSYLDWFSTQGIPYQHRLDQKKFGGRLDALGFESKRSNSGVKRVGLWLIDDAGRPKVSSSIADLGERGIVVNGPLNVVDGRSDDDGDPERAVKNHESLMLAIAASHGPIYAEHFRESHLSGLSTPDTTETMFLEGCCTATTFPVETTAWTGAAQ